MICVNVRGDCRSVTVRMLAEYVAESLFRVEPLVAGRAAAVLPFIRLFEPGLTQERWRDFVRSFAKAGAGGLMIIQDRRGYVHGVFSCRPAYSIGHGRVLRVADVVLPRLPGTATLRTFLDGVKQLAADFGCNAVLIELGERTRHIRSDLESLSDTGFSASAITYCCPVPA